MYLPICHNIVHVIIVVYDVALILYEYNPMFCKAIFDFVCFPGWIDDLQFNIIFDSISVITGQWVGDSGRLCAMESCL